MMGISVGALFIGVILLFAVVIVVAMPLLQRREEEALIVTEALGEEDLNPARRRMRVLLALRDLEFDHLTGKVSEEDYQALRSQLLMEAAALLQSAQSRSSLAGAGKSVAYLEERIRKAIQARRSNRCPHCGHPTRPGAQFCAMCGQPISEGARCPKCGAQVMQNARFCTACGHALTLAHEAG